MEELRDLAAANRFRVLVLAQHPQSTERKQRSLKTARGLGFHVLDLGPLHRVHLLKEGRTELRGSSLGLSESDGHPSVLAHTITGDALMGMLLQYRLIKVGNEHRNKEDGQVVQAAAGTGEGDR